MTFAAGDVSQDTVNKSAKEVLDSLLQDVTNLQATVAALVTTFNAHVHSGVTAGSANSAVPTTVGTAPSAVQTTDAGVIDANVPQEL